MTTRIAAGFAGLARAWHDCSAMHARALACLSLFGLALGSGSCGDAPGGGADTSATDADSEGPDDDDSEAQGSASGSSPTSTTSDPSSDDSTTATDSAPQTTTASESSGDAETTDGIPPTSPACGQALASDWYAPFTVFWGEETLHAEVESDGVTREYLLELPANYDPNTAYPIIFTYHGLGANMENAFGQHVGDLWGNEVVAVYPQGIDNTWDLAVGGPDVSFFTAVLNQIGNEVCLDMTSVFVQGTSMGGGMSNFIACVAGDLVAGSGPAASWFPIDPSNCIGPVPQFIVHGTNDPTVSFDSGVQARDTWLAVNGCSETSTPVEPSPCMIYDDCNSGAPVVWCAHDGGHDQPNVHGLDDDMMAFFMSLR